MNSNLPPWLTDDEIANLTKPLVQAAARKRYLRGLGLPVREKPNGDPLVLRSELEKFTGQTGQKPKAKPQPSRSALMAVLGKAA